MRVLLLALLLVGGCGTTSGKAFGWGLLGAGSVNAAAWTSYAGYANAEAKNSGVWKYVAIPLAVSALAIVVGAILGSSDPSPVETEQQRPTAVPGANRPSFGDLLVSSIARVAAETKCPAREVRVRETGDPDEMGPRRYALDACGVLYRCVREMWEITCKRTAPSSAPASLPHREGRP